MCMMKAYKNGNFVEAPYDIDLMSFEFEGTCITNPFLSECSRFSADPKSYGFVEAGTGGGCMALILDLPNGDSLWMTDGSGCCLPDPADLGDVMLGRFNAEHEQVAYIMLSDIPSE